MKEILRHHELHQVTRYMDIPENVGLETLLRNENLSVTDAPIPEFFPNLSVFNGEEFSNGMKLFCEHNERIGKGAEFEERLPSFGEMKPGNFDVCFSCHESINQSMLC